MKRKYAAIAGAILLAFCLGLAFWFMHSRTPATPVKEKGPVIAYADVEHIMMSHPAYSQYHHLELEYNAMVAQYQFEQWNYSHQAALQGKAERDFSVTDALSTAALNQELQARVAIKQNELNAGLEQKYQELLQTKKQEQPELSAADNLKIVNLRLKLETMVLSKDERQGSHNHAMDEATIAEVKAAMAPEKEKAQKELEAYALQVKNELQARQQKNQSVFQQQLGELNKRPEPAVWNKEWKDKLEQKEKEMNEQKEKILADIREKAASVAQEQGIDLILSNYEGVGTARDVTDDIIVKLV